MWNVFGHAKDNEIVLIAQSWAYVAWPFVQIKTKIKQIEEYHCGREVCPKVGPVASRSTGQDALPLIGQRVSALTQKGCPIGPRSRDSGGFSLGAQGAEPLLFLQPSVTLLSVVPSWRIGLN